MAKDLYEENKELKRVLYNIEKAILDFRLTQLDLPLEKVNIPSLGIPQAQPVSYTCSCNNGEGCSCDEEKEVLREQIAALTAKLNGANAELDLFKKKEHEKRFEEAKAKIKEIFSGDIEEEPVSPVALLKKKRKHVSQEKNVVALFSQTLKI